MRIHQFTNEAKWSKKYKSSIDCANPKGFSQKAHCAGKKKNESLEEQGSTRRLTVEPHMAGLENPYQKTNKKELKVFTPAYKDMYNQARAAQDRANATGGPGASYQTPVMKPKFSPQVLPPRTTPKKPRLVNSVVEGYKLQLERGSDMDVLHITDTKTGKRTEVRGKPDYERNYDANDPLHQLLDRIGKAANISELINGEPVGINPNHPDGERAKKDTDKAFNESTDLDSLRKFVRSQREAPDQVLYQMMMAPDTYGHAASNFVRSWYEKTKEENGLNDVDSALEIMVDELGLKDTDKAFNERKLTKKETRKRDKLVDKLPANEFKKRYGKDWEAVMYGTATNMAKKNK